MTGGPGAGDAGRRDGLTHLDDEGRPRMVDVSGKEETPRRAVAEGRIRMEASTLRTILDGAGPKGDVLQVARLAGIQAGKRTAELIPLCHALPGASVEIEIEAADALPGLVVRAEARYVGRTGVEMEALTAAAVALLTVYDMAKALDRGMTIEGIRLLSKEGGSSGSWSARE